jgi:hypothetical protein
MIGFEPGKWYISKLTGVVMIAEDDVNFEVGHVLGYRLGHQNGDNHRFSPKQRKYWIELSEEEVLIYRMGQDV